MAGDDTAPGPEPAAAPERDPEPEPEQPSETPGGTPPMIYNGIAIRDRDGKLNLTDMWKAHRIEALREGRSEGELDSRRPAQWLRSKDAKRFSDFLATAVGISHTALFDAGSGGDGAGGATWAHWQLGLAYAKYLSPGFHAWCNQVVRDRMEGKIGRPEELEARIRAEVEAEIGGKLTSGPTKRELGAQTAAILRATIRNAGPEVHHQFRHARLPREHRLVLKTSVTGGTSASRPHGARGTPAAP